MMLRQWKLKFLAVALGGTAAIGIAVPASAAVILVNDTWQDGTDSDPGPVNQSEFGVDHDSDGDIESAWYQGGGGTLDPAGAGGPLDMTLGESGSSSWTTYFTPEGKEVELLSAGDQLKVTWKFTLSGVNTGGNGSQNFRLAVVDSPAASRVLSDAAPASQAYSGYAVFANMGETLNRSDPWELMKRGDSGGNLLSSSGEWIAKVEDGDDEAAGYDDDVEYTMEMTLTRTAADELEYVASISGGDLNGSGSLSATFLDTSPTTWDSTQPIPGGGFKFDTFSLRPSDAATTAASFHTTSFTVVAPVPEPATMALLALGGLGIIGCARRR